MVRFVAILERENENRWTHGDQQIGNLKIDLEEIRRLCVSAITTLLGKVFTFSGRIKYAEGSEGVP